MSIELELSCSYCGRRLPYTLALTVANMKPANLKRQVAKIGWIVELNGENLDLYCCKSCSKGQTIV